MIDLEKYYLKLPVSLQHIICSFEGYRIQVSRFGGNFPKILQEVRSRSLWRREQIKVFRDQRLRAFIMHCIQTVPYYRRRLSEGGINPESIQTLEDLQRLPILTKEEVQNHYLELVSEAVPRKQQLIIHTSGTTGGGLRFATTLLAIQEQYAVWWRYRCWHDLQPGTWCGYFGGRSVVPLSQAHPPFWRYNYPGKQILFSGYHLSPANLDAYVNELRRRRPPWLHGYPSLLALLAGHILETGIDLGYQVRWVTIGAENLLSQQADLMEQAFGVRPKQHYGMAEAVANISECDCGRLHVDEDFAAVEFVPNLDGPGYKIIGTNFTNPAMPLLRYDVQDLVDLTDAASCSCGCPGRVVERIDGRKEDYVVLKNGARLGRLDHIFKDLVNIREAQVLQQRRGEIIIRVVKGKNYTEHDSMALLQETRKRVGEDADILIEHVSHLERSPGGKLRFVVSEIKEGKLEG